MKANSLLAVRHGGEEDHSRSLLVGSQNTNSRVWSQTGSSVRRHGARLKVAKERRAKISRVIYVVTRSFETICMNAHE